MVRWLQLGNKHNLFPGSESRHLTTLYSSIKVVGASLIYSSMVVIKEAGGCKIDSGSCQWEIFAWLGHGHMTHKVSSKSHTFLILMNFCPLPKSRPLQVSKNSDNLSAYIKRSFIQLELDFIKSTKGL